MSFSLGMEGQGPDPSFIPERSLVFLSWTIVWFFSGTEVFLFGPFRRVLNSQPV